MCGPGTASAWKKCGKRAHREAGAGRHAAMVPGNSTAPGIVLPDREKMKTQMEALIHHFKIVTEGMRVPAGEAYQAPNRRAARLPTTSSATASDPHRVFMRTPSFGNLQACRRCRRQADCRHDRFDGQHGLRTRRRGQVMTFSPELEQRLSKLMDSYPQGRIGRL